MPLIPWKLVTTWSCFACGKCCRKFKVPLSLAEAQKLMEKYGSNVIEFERGTPYLKRKGGTCIFQDGNICSIQEDKPTACKLWPFYVKKAPLHPNDFFSAHYRYKDKVFYIYIHSWCTGVNKGVIPVHKILPEVVSLYLGEQTSQIFTTSTFHPEDLLINVITTTKLITNKIL
ncbi:MAG: YkgJ family cysteine cluster protein [Candidatus Baldrarchaeia archaeon]